MMSASKNLYHHRGCDAKALLDTYFSNKSDMAFGQDALQVPMEKLHNALVKGHIKGTTVNDCSMGPIIHHLYSICEFFDNIIVMRFSERCIMELNKWRHDRTGAFDWTHTKDFVKQLEGEREEEKELKLKKAIKHIVKCNIGKKNLIDPLVLPQSDCLISSWLLECISKDEEDYIQNMNKVLNHLKPGGHLILLGVLGGTYYTVGKETFHLLKYDDNLVKKALIKEGYTIDDCEVFPRMSQSDLSDYTSTMLLIAHKE